MGLDDDIVRFQAAQEANRVENEERRAAEEALVAQHHADELAETRRWGLEIVEFLNSKAIAPLPLVVGQPTYGKRKGWQDLAAYRTSKVTTSYAMIARAYAVLKERVVSGRVARPRVGDPRSEVAFVLSPEGALLSSGTLRQVPQNGTDVYTTTDYISYCQAECHYTDVFRGITPGQWVLATFEEASEIPLSTLNVHPNDLRNRVIACLSYRVSIAGLYGMNV